MDFRVFALSGRASEVAGNRRALYCVCPMISLCSVRRAVLPCLLVLLLTGATPVSAQGNKKRVSPTPGASPKSTPYVLPDTVATVNGEPIKKKDLERVTQSLVGNTGRSLQDLTIPEQKAAYEAMLNTMIADKLVAREAANEAVEDLSVEKRYGDLMAQYPDPKAFQEQIKKAGETEAQIKAHVRGQLQQQQWLNKQVAEEAKVTPQEVEKFYKESPPNKFDEPEVVHARHILVAVRKDAPPEDALAAETHANALLERVRKGEKFEEVAAKQSDDPAAHDRPAANGSPAVPGNGGDLGYFARDRIMPEFGDVAFRLKVGEIGGPVRTQFGYHLIQVVDHLLPHTANLDEARDQITAYLQSEKRQAAVSRLLDGLRAGAKVQTFLP